MPSRAACAVNAQADRHPIFHRISLVQTLFESIGLFWIAGVPLGLGVFGRLVNAAPIPVIGLGGVTATNLRACLEAGAAGAAVLGAVMAARDPAGAMATLLDKLNEGSEADPKTNPVRS